MEALRKSTEENYERQIRGKKNSTQEKRKGPAVSDGSRGPLRPCDCFDYIAGAMLST